MQLMNGGHPSENPSRRPAGSLTAAAGFTFESLILMALLTLVAVVAKRAGALPGSGTGFLGDAVAGGFFACLYAGLGIAYSRVPLKEGRSSRGLLRTLGLCLTLAVISTYFIMLGLTPAAWDRYFYLRLIAPPAFAGLWCIALLPRETGDLYRIAGTAPVFACLRPLAMLLGAATFLVTCSDLAMQFGTSSESETAAGVIRTNAWVTNILILFGAYAVTFAVTSKAATALLFVSPVYVALGLATIAKLNIMHSPVSPLDLLYVGEFLPLFRKFFGIGILAATVCGLIAWILALVALRRVPPDRTPLGFRGAIGVFSLAALLAIPIKIEYFPDKQVDLYHLVGAPHLWLTSNEESTRKSGFLLSFLSEIPASFVAEPPDYSPEAVAAALRRIPGRDIAPTALDRGRRVNLIVYMIESFMYPEDLGWHYSSDPMPNLRDLQGSGIGGYAVVPGKFGGSSNTEFEALTGMTMTFLPERSLPYRQYVKRPMPSLPGALKHSGYRTIAVQADPMYFFNREQVYDLLGFDEVSWIHEAPGIERASQGFWPSDNAIVEAVIRGSRQARPFFIFAFPSSTHAPYDHGIYGISDLRVLDPVPGNAAGEVNGYINALRAADQAIGMLIGYFRKQPDPTMIAVIGDHLPPLSGEALRSFNVGMRSLSKNGKELKRRSVPLLIWTNFDLPREKVNISMNALPSYLLEKMKIMPRGFLAATDAIRLKLPILSGGYGRGIDGFVLDRDSLSGEEKILVDDYHLLQYDLLIGKQYSLRSSFVGDPSRVSGTAAERGSRRGVDEPAQIP